MENYRIAELKKKIQKLLETANNQELAEILDQITIYLKSS
jgi:protein-arginine kinase activator protein McsA